MARRRRDGTLAAASSLSAGGAEHTGLWRAGAEEASCVILRFLYVDCSIALAIGGALVSIQNSLALFFLSDLNFTDFC